MPDAGFYLMATQMADVKRLPPLVDGRRGQAELYLSNLACTPLDPVSESTSNRLRLQTPTTMRECFMEEGDVVKGDVLVFNGRDHPVSYVERREWTDGSTYLHVVLEALQR